MTRRSIERYAEVATALTLAGAAIVLGVLDMTTGLERLGLREKGDAMLLIGLGGLLIGVHQLLLAHHRNEARTGEIERRLGQDLVARLPEVADTIDPGFRIVAGNVVSERLHDLRQMLTTRRFCIDGPDDYREFYIKAMNALEPGTQLLATSIPHSKFFWSGTAVDDAIVAFMRRGGRIQRVFFVSKEDCADPIVIQVLDRQADIGVDVFLCDPQALRVGERFILCDMAGQFGWDVNVDRDGNIRWADVSAERSDIRDFHGYFAAIDACPQLVPYKDHDRPFRVPTHLTRA